MAIMDNPYGNLLALLQSGALGPGNGPIQPQNPQPGFRAPGTPGIAMPQQQQPGGLTAEQGRAGLSGALAAYRPGGGSASPSPFAGIDVSNMTPDQQIAAFSTYGNKGASPFTGVDMSGMTPDQQIAAFSSYAPQSGGGFFGNLFKGLF